MDHTFLTSLVDQNGTLRVQYMGVKFDPDEMLRDLQSLVKEREKIRNSKSEIRNKFQNMKYKTTTMFQTGRTEFSVLDFPSLRFNWLRFVSDFELRISDFAFVGLFRSARPLSIFGFRICFARVRREKTIHLANRYG